MSATWYYVDLSDQQVGPVTADDVRAALSRGETDESSLAWREGLAEWQPISQLASELGFTPASTPPPPRPSESPPETPQRRSDEVVYAGFWRRFAARVIDHFVVSLPVGVVLVLMSALTGIASTNPYSDPYGNQFGIHAVFYSLYFVVTVLYFAGMESSSLQATVGKLALGIKVTDNAGRRLSFGHALARWFAATLSYLTLYIGFFMAGFTERKRALHDMVASTLVVDKWSYSESPERQQRGMSGCLIAFLVFFVGGLLIVPILAAIAIPMYQDAYVIRAQVSEASALAASVKLSVAEYVQENGSFPQSHADAGLAEASQISGAYVSYVDVGKSPGRIEAGFSSSIPYRADSALDGKRLYFDASIDNGNITWTCHSNELKQKWCPSSCACSG